MQLQQLTPSHILFVDPSVDNYLGLLNGLTPNTEVFVLDTSEDGIEQITRLLAQRQNLKSIQILSHGLTGGVNLGTTQLNSENLQDYSGHLQAWGKALSSDGDILLYGCDVAGGENGQSFINNISSLTGADVTASNDLTGNTLLGGDWDLEYRVGNIEARSVLGEQARSDYQEVLATTGWNYTYYEQNDYTGKTTSSTTSRVTTDWGSSGPIIAGSRETNNFSAIWSGYLVPDQTGWYKFGMRADDYMSVSINGNSWEVKYDSGKKTYSTYLYKGNFYETSVRFREYGGSANVLLEVSEPDDGSGYYTYDESLFSPFAPPKLSISANNTSVNEGSNAQFTIKATMPYQAEEDQFKKLYEDGLKAYNNLSSWQKTWQTQWLYYGSYLNVYTNYKSLNQKTRDKLTSISVPLSIYGVNGATSADWSNVSSVNLRGENTTISVPITDDIQYESPNNEGIRVTLSEGQPSYILSGTTSASQTINDNDSAPKLWLESTVNVNNPNNPSSEATGKSLFKIKVDNASKIRKEGVYVNFTYWIANDDLGGTVYGTTIYPNISSQDYFISIPIKDDSIYESGETVKVELKDDSWYDLDTSKNQKRDDTKTYSNTSITQPIIDNDMKAGLRPITPGPKEGQSDVDGYTVQFDYPVQEATDIYVSYDDSRNDLSGETSWAVRVPYNSKSANAKVTPTDDTYHENTEYVFVKLQNNSYYGVDSSGTHYETGLGYSYYNNATLVRVNENEPLITIGQTNHALEGENNGEFILDFDNPSPQDFNNFKFKLTGTAKHATLVAPAADTDYKIYYEAFNVDNKSLATGAIDPRTDLTYTIPTVLKDTKKLVIKVMTINNEVWEPTEDVGIELLEPGFDNWRNGYEFYRLGTNKKSTLNIVDNEPIVSFGKVVQPSEGFGYGSTIETLGSALELNGSTFLKVDSNNKLDLSQTGKFTQEAWIFPNINDGKKRGILGYSTKANDQQAYPSIWQVNNTGIEVGFGDGQKYQGFTVPNVLNQSTWNHIATSFDGEKYRLYVNGVEVYADESFKGRQIAPTQQLGIGKVEEISTYSAKFSVKVPQSGESKTYKAQLTVSLDPNSVYSFQPSTVRIGRYDFSISNIKFTNDYYVDIFPGYPTYGKKRLSNYTFDVTTNNVNAKDAFSQLGTGRKAQNLTFPGNSYAGGVTSYSKSQITETSTPIYNFNPATVNIAGNSLPVKYLTNNGNGQFTFDVETQNSEIANAINKVNTADINSLKFDGNNPVSQFVSKSQVTRTLLPTDPNAFFTGTVDEVRIWNIARTAGEIQDSMLTPLGGEETGLVGYWPFENNTNDASKIVAIGAEETDASKAIKPANAVVQGNVSPQYINNPSPQIGYVEVNLDKPFEGEQGLWLKYNIDGGTATKNTDYFNSRYRKVSTDINSEADGIIIPKGQTQGKIYFVAKPDQIVEGDENLNISLLHNNFDLEGNNPNNVTISPANQNTNYQIKDNSQSQTITIKDNSAYKLEVIALDKYNRLITDNNPLYVNPNGRATVQVKLASQPTSSTSINVGGQSVSFSTTNWDQLQKLELTGQNASRAITISGSINGTSVNTTLPVTDVAPQLLQVEEGSTSDIKPVTPQVSISQAGNATEGVNEPGKFVVNLNAPAPAGGLVINYSLSGSAVLANDYQVVEDDNSQVTGKSLQLNGTNNQYVNLSNGKTTANKLGLPTKNITVEAWVKVNQFNSWASVLGFIDDGTPGGFSLGTWSDGRFYFGLASQQFQWNSFNNTYQKGQWYHLAATYNGNQVQLFVNGELAGTASQTGDIRYADSWYRLGSYKDNNEEYLFNGQIQDVRVWNTARSQAEIKANMNKQLTGKETGLVNYYKLDEGNGTLIKDATGKASGNVIGSNVNWLNDFAPLTPAPNNNVNKQVFVPAGENSIAIPIIATDDINKESTENVQVTLKTGAGYTLNSNKQNATINIIDNEQVAIQVVNATVTNDPVTSQPIVSYASTLNPIVVREDGSKEFLGVHLTTQPTTNVTIALSTTDATEAEITPSSLVFTPSNWNKYQQVTVTGKQDVVYDKDVDYQIKLEANSSDTFYSGQKILLDAKTLDDEQPTDTVASTGDAPDANRPTASIFVSQLPTETIAGKVTIDLSQAVADGGKITVLLGTDGGNAQLNKDYYFSGINLFRSQYAIANNGSGARQKIFDSPVDGITPGSNSKFTFGDLDNDGDLDLVTGNADGILKYYERSTDGKFTEKTGTNSPFRDIKFTGEVAPVLVDLSGDGKLDLIVKNSTGQLNYYQNRSDANNTIFLANSGNPFANLTIASSPTFFDLNQDKKLDIVFVDADGQVVYRLNGASSNISLGTKVDSPKQTSVSNIDWDNDDDQDLVVGKADGSFTYLENTSTGTTTKFTVNDAKNPLAGTKQSGNGSVAFADLDQDGDLDAVVSSKDAGFGYYQQVQAVEFKSGEKTKEITIQPINDKIDEGEKETLQLNILSNTGYQLETSTTPKILNPDDQGFSYATGKLFNQNYEFTGAASIISSYKMTAGNTVTQAPSSWTLKASSDKANWVTLDTRSNIKFSTAQQVQEFKLENTTAYKYYRLEVTNNNGGDGIAVSKVEFSGPPLASATSLNIADDDLAGVTVTPSQTGKTTDETGQTVLEYSAKLNSKPLFPVMVSFGTNDLTEAKVKTSSTSTLVDFVDLVFTPENWDKPQKFYVQGIDDKIADGNIPYKLITTTRSEDQLYHRLTINPLSLTNNNDTDKAELSIVKMTDGVAEGRENIYKVKLSSQPVGEVQVIADPINDQIRINNTDYGDPMTLTFDETNWDIEQIVRVSAFDDNIVENNHTSQIKFTVLSGESQDFESVAINDSAEGAIDLGEIAGGYSAKNLVLDNTATKKDEDWFKFTLTDAGTDKDYIEIPYELAGSKRDITAKLYHASNPTTAIKTVSANTSDNNKLRMNLPGVESGEYLLAITSPGQAAYKYSLTIADEDNSYVNLQSSLKPLDVQIKDNDLPTAKIIAGPTASEIFGQPSYFAVMLNAPATQKDGGTGLNINYKITGGTATLDDATKKILGDYKVASDGTIRIAPGEVQNNIVIVPIDDKITEDLKLNITKVGNISNNSTTGKANVTLNVFVPSEVSNVSEPNNFSTQFSKLAGSDQLSFSNLSIERGDQDWYKFTLNTKADEEDYIQIDPAYKFFSGDLDIVLYNANKPDTVIRSSSKSGTKVDKISLDDLSPGEYLVKVYGYNGSTNNYTLEMRAPITGSIPIITKGSTVKFGNDISGKVVSDTKTFGNSSYKYEAIFSIISNNRYFNPTTVTVDGYKLSVKNIRTSPLKQGYYFDVETSDPKVADSLARVTSSYQLNFNNSNYASSIVWKSGIKKIPTIANNTSALNAEIVVELNDEDVEAVKQAKEAKIAGETVQVELQPGTGYKLSENNSIATMNIHDDDVPGIRIVEIGEHTTVGEEESADFAIGLLSEPSAPVTIKLTPGAEIEFVNPNSPSSVLVEKQIFSFDNTVANAKNIDVKLNSLVTTDRFDTVAFDFKMKTAPQTGKLTKYRISDANDLNPNDKSRPLQELIFYPDGTLLDKTLETTDAPEKYKPGNWQDIQQVVLTNLDKDALGKYKLRVEKLTYDGLDNITGKPVNEKSLETFDLPIQQTTTKVDKKTTSITIDPANWFKLQTITVKGSKDNVPEPGIFHTSPIKYSVTSSDPNYNKLFTPDQTIEVVDRYFNPEEASAGINESLGTLQESVDNISLPLVGKLEGKSPNLIGDLGGALKTKVGGAEQLTAMTLKKNIEEVLKTMGLEFFTVNVQTTSQDTIIELKLSKQMDWSLPLDVGLGIPAVGIGFETEGDLRAKFNFDMNLTFGLHKKFGFYMDTKKTSLKTGIKLDLNQFKGSGSLGILSLDFADDPKNPTELAVSFTASLNDLDDIKKKKATAGITTRSTIDEVIDVNAETIEDIDFSSEMASFQPVATNPESDKLLADLIKLEEKLWADKLAKEAEQRTEDNQSSEQKITDKDKSDQDLADLQTRSVDSDNITLTDVTDAEQGVLTVKAEDIKGAIAQANTEKTALKLEELIGEDLADVDNKLSAEIADKTDDQTSDQVNNQSEFATTDDLSIDLSKLEAELSLDNIETSETIVNDQADDQIDSIDLSETETIATNTKKPILRKASVIESNTKPKNLEETLTLIGGEKTDLLDQDSQSKKTDSIQTRAIQTRDTTEPLSNEELEKILIEFGIAELNDIIPSGQVILTTTSDKIQVNYQGTTTLADWLNISDIPEFSLTDTVVIYDKVKQTYSFASQINIAGSAFDLAGTLVEKIVDGQEQLDWQKLTVANVPITDLKAGFPQLEELFPASGTATLELATGNIQLQYQGDITVTNLLESVVGAELFIPEVTLSNPVFTYVNTAEEKKYSFQSGKLLVSYQNDLTNGSYNLVANQLPVGDLTSWLEQDLGLLGISKLITGTANLNFTPTNKSVKVNGSMDLSQLIKSMAKNNQLPIPSLNIDNPAINYQITDTGNIYDFSSDTITVNYQPKADGTYAFTAKKLPIGGVTSWANTQLGISNIGDFATGTVDVNLVKNTNNDTSRSISVNGSVDVGALLKAVSNNKNLAIPNLQLDNPTISYASDSTGKNYQFSSETITVNYQSNTDGTYALNATKLPIGGVTSWMENQLGVANISNLAIGAVDVNIINNGATDKTQEIKFSGAVDVSQILKSINANLPIPSLKVTKPSLKYTISDTGKVYDFTSETLKVNYQSNNDGTYKLTATQVPTGGMTSWLENQLGLTSIGNFVTGDANILVEKTNATNVNTSVSFSGGVDVGAVVKAIAQDQNLPTPPLNVNNPTFSYKAEDTGKIYNFTSDTIKVNYQTKTNGDYNFGAEELPTGGLTDWLETELGLKNISEAVTGNLDVDLVKTGTTDIAKSVKFSGSVDLSALIKAITTSDTLPIPSLQLDNPQVSYQANSTAKVYDFVSDTITANYQAKTDGTYKLTANKLPIGKLTDWLATDFNLTNIDELATGTANISVINNGATDITKTLKFTGNVNIATLITAISDNNVPVPDLTLSNPEISYQTSPAGTVYDFTSDTIKINYETKIDGTYSLTATKLPVGGLTSWVDSNLGVTGLSDLMTGTVDIKLSQTNALDTEKAVKFTGDVDAGALIKAIANDQTLPLPDLNLSNPEISYKLAGTEKVYNFTSDTLGINYTTNTDADGNNIYSLQVTKLPVGGLTSWLETQLGIKSISGVSGTVDIQLDKTNATDLSSAVKFTGNVDITALVKAIANDSTLPISAISLTDPSISYSNIAGVKQYVFTSGNTKVDYTLNPDQTYVFNVSELPLGAIADWFSKNLGISDDPNKFITGTANGNFTPDQKSISITGSLDFSQLAKSIAQDQNLPIPSLQLTNPSISYSNSTTGKIYDFTSDNLTINYQVNYTNNLPNGTYNLKVTQLPLGGLTSWLESQGLANMGDVITATADITVDKKGPLDVNTVVKFAGDLDAGKLVNALANSSSLDVPSLNLSEPEFTYQKNTTGNIYELKTDSGLEIYYAPQTDGNYTFSGKQLPLGSLATWLKTQVGVTDIGISDGTANIDFSKTSTTDSSKSVSFSGAIDLGKVISSISGNALNLPDLSITTPKLAYTTNSTGKIYDLTGKTIHPITKENVDLTVKYDSENDGSYNFKSTNLPIGNLSSWAESQLGIKGLKDLVTGTVDLALVKDPATAVDNKTLKINGSVDISKLITAIPGANSLAIPSVNLINPQLTYSTQTDSTTKLTSTIYDLTTTDANGQPDMAIKYTSRSDSTYELTATKLPVGKLTTWAKDQLKVTDIDLSTGQKIKAE